MFNYHPEHHLHKPEGCEIPFRRYIKPYLLYRITVNITVFQCNSLPYIGRANETIRLVNTKFEPLLIEVEMVEHDEETISVMLEGNQIRNLDNGLITTYNFDNEIFRQHEYFTIKETTGRNLYDVKMDRGDNIDSSQDFNEITNAAR